MLATQKIPSDDGNIRIKRSASEEVVENQDMAESVETATKAITQPGESDKDCSADSKTDTCNTDSVV